MSYLFIISNKTVYPNPETLLISPFKEIWERDKRKGKETAIEELSYIEFMSSMRKTNPFRQYSESRKQAEIIKSVITQDNWKPDKLVKKGIEKIKEFQREASTTYSYYLAAKKAAEKMQNFFNEVDINERNTKTGNPIYKPRDITSALNDTETTLTKLKNLEKKLEQELYDTIRNKGDKEIGFFATRESLNEKK